MKLAVALLEPFKLDETKDDRRVWITPVDNIIRVHSGELDHDAL